MFAVVLMLFGVVSVGIVTAVLVLEYTKIKMPAKELSSRYLDS